APRLVDGRIVRGDGSARAVPSALWNVRERLRAMDSAGLSHQVISPVPEIMTQAWPEDPAYARAVNDSIAQACRESGGRLIGLGCLPRSDPAAELARCLGLGLRGVLVGTRMAGSGLDVPGLSSLWASCEEAGACVFVHPIDHGRGVLCRSEPQMEIGLGMPADTAVAATALVFGGVLARYPGLRVLLAHGGSAFPWVYPRLRMAAEGPGERWDALVRRLFVDTLVFDAAHLPLLAHRFGPDRLLLGTDSPFLSEHFADAARIAGVLPGALRRAVEVPNARTFLGLPVAEHPGSRRTSTTPR
ncbi:MAG TPA: amidohydrolase family protein, partial [Streptomyces sp.]